MIYKTNPEARNRSSINLLLLTMRLIILLICFNITSVLGNGIAQTITLKIKNTSLAKVMNSVQKQSGYDFFLKGKEIANINIEVDIKDLPLNEAMSEILNGKSASWKLEGKTIVITGNEGTAIKGSTNIASQKNSSKVQERAIAGKVVDQHGQALSGVSISVIGSSRATASKDDGSFQIQAEIGDRLRFSYVGYQTEERRVVNFSPMEVILQLDEADLDEVVVVAYGTQKRSTMVGSVSQIKGEEIKKAPPMNITNTLGGRIPGLTTLQQSGRPGSDNASLYVRGIGTYGSNRSPLIIIDDVERPASTLAYLDPNEIESISVLKDAVAVAAYGAMAANGIIVVKTKEGVKDSPSLNYEFNYNLSENTRFPEFLDGPDYMAWYNKGIEVDNELLRSVGKEEIPYLYSQELIDAVRDGTNENPLFGNTDWIGGLLGRKAGAAHHSATVSGGSESTQYFAAVSHLNQEGVVKNTDFKRYNVRTNLNTNLNEYIAFGLNVGLRQQLSNLPGISPDNTTYMNPFYQAVRMLPNLPMYAPNGLPTAYQAGAGWVNPIASVEQSGFQKFKTNIFQGQANLNLKAPWVEGLTGKISFSYDNSTQEAKSWTSPYELMGRAREQVTGDYVHLTTIPGISKSTLRQSLSANSRKTLQANLSYNTVINQVHSIGFLGLYEYSRASGNQFSAGASNFALDIIKDINYGSKDPEDFISPTGSTKADESRAGVVTRINYSYDEKYLFEFVSRWDASVNFSRENRWKPSAGVGLGWVVSKENFFQSELINQLKLKGSIGTAGNDRANLGTFPYMRTYSQTSTPSVVIDGVPVSPIFINQLENPDLKWETSTLYNIGIETMLFDGKLGFDFEWFYRYTKGILGAVSNLFPPSMGGYYPSLANIGELDNRGFDAQIRFNQSFGDLKMRLVGNVNWSRNRYLKLDEAAGTPVYRSLIGKSVGTKIGFVSEGIVDTWEEGRNTPSPNGTYTVPGFFKYKDLNGDGKVTRTDDMTYIGKANVPELMYGLTIDLEYKGIDFSALLQGAGMSHVNLAGTYEGASGTSGIDDNTPFTRAFYNFGNSPYFLVENAWRPDNLDAEFPRLSAYKATVDYTGHNGNQNSGWIRKGDYLRLKTLQLGYTLPKTFTSRLKVENVRLSVTGSNLFTFDYLKYLDPEMPNVNNGFYPQQRMYSFGLSATF